MADSTTVASLVRTRLVVIRCCSGVGWRGTACRVVTSGSRSASTSDRTYEPSAPPKIPGWYWSETTSTTESFIASAMNPYSSSASRRILWRTSAGYASGPEGGWMATIWRGNAAVARSYVNVATLHGCGM